MSKVQEVSPQEKRNAELASELNKLCKDYASSNSDLRDKLNLLTIDTVREFKVMKDNKESGKALLVYLPQQFHFHQPQAVLRLMQEFQKKKGMTVFMTAKRTVVHPRSGYKQKIPRSRTLTAVYEALLDDLIAPSDIMGKRTRHRLGGSIVLKVELDEENRGFLAPRLDAVKTVYRELTKKELSFDFVKERCYAIIPKVKKRKTTDKKRNRKERRQEKAPTAE
uniref:40S ribosomal protein S7 n=1 Tax=Lepeophtheirus salmonis TaxID=72036 RepID=D3PJC3_LEPSM|nr:40S ribosomal protein S7-1 [Lepeophtheirus salmonis]